MCITDLSPAQIRLSFRDDVPAGKWNEDAGRGDEPAIADADSWRG